MTTLAHVVELTRYWFEFDWGDEEPPPGARFGCGVTALGAEDALALLRERVFVGRDLPPIKRMIEDVDVSTLDEGHVLPNMAPPNWRGVWFPPFPT